MEYSVKSVVLKSLYCCFQIGIGRSTLCVWRWSALDNIPDLVQVGRHVFAGVWNGLRFEIYVSPVYAYKAAKDVEPSNLSLCCNGTVGIVLRAKNTNLNSRWLTWIFSPASDGFHKRWTSNVAFNRFTKGLTSIVACL